MNTIPSCLIAESSPSRPARPTTLAWSGRILRALAPRGFRASARWGAALAGAVACLTLANPASAASSPPDLMTYQGYLVDANGNPLATNAPANYPVAFRIYSSPTASTPDVRLWSEQQIVTVDRGSFSVVLGEGTTIGGEARPALSSIFSGPTASDRYMGITVTIAGSALEILPRLRMLPSAYSFLAGSAASLVTPAGSNLVTYANNRVEVDGPLRISSVNTPQLSVESPSGFGSWLSMSSAAPGGRSWQMMSLGQSLVSSPGNFVFGTGPSPGVVTNVVLTLRPDGLLGVGTSFPNYPLSFGNGLANTKLALWDGGVGSAYGFGIQPGQFRFHVNQASDRFTFLNGPAGGELVNILGNGNVGLGTATPAAKLDVRGDVRVGNGDLVAAASENLRIVRGVVRLDGTKFNGAGYTVTRTAAGAYTLNFSPAFADVPAVTVSPAPNQARPCTATWDNGNAGSILIQTWSGATQADMWFNFVAIGAR